MEGHRLQTEAYNIDVQQARVDIFVVYNALGLTECNCSGLHMVAQHTLSINNIILYIFINTFILRRSKNEYVPICYDQESPPQIYISYRFCQVLWSFLSTFISTANLSRG